MFPDKLVSFEFDQNCYHSIEVMMTEGLPNLIHHIECRQVKLKVDGEPDRYVPLGNPHRIGCSWSDLKNIIKDKNEVWIHPQELKELKEMKLDLNRQKEFDLACRNFQTMSGMSKDWIVSKIEENSKG